MKWMTNWPRVESPNKIEPGHRVLAVGSCFAEHMAKRLGMDKCRVLLNPYGILYNPISIAGALSEWVTQGNAESRIVLDCGLYHSLDHHSQFSDPVKQKVRDSIDTARHAATQFVEQTSLAIVSLGTAWVYDWKDDGEVVANCHKIPSGHFEKRLPGLNELGAAWHKLLETWKNKQPGLRVILTVSPVRHLKDGFIENQRSKSTLILLAHELSDAYDFVEYFPSYEIMVDELRDYRFYARDLVHPSPEAVDHIIEAFTTCYYSKALRDLSQRLKGLHQSLNHKPFHPRSAAYEQHLRVTGEQLDRLMSEYPDLEWAYEHYTLKGVQANRSD
jgi:hypothetical protein